jgi:hypothetical protein
MRAVKKSTALIVRPRLSRWHYLLLSLVVFCLTIGVVFGLSKTIFYKPDEPIGSKAVAVVKQTPIQAENDLFKASVLGQELTQQNIETRIFSPSFMQKALHESGVSILPERPGDSHCSTTIPSEQLRKGLSIQVHTGAIPDEKRISLDLVLPQSPDAAKIVYALADRLVHEYRAYWAAEVRKSYLTVLAEADNANQSHREALKRLHSYKDDIAKAEQTTPASRPMQADMAAQTTAQLVDNPAWMELDNKISMLRKQEANLLINKTSVHPDIQIIRGRIADFEQQLAFTSRYRAESFSTAAIQQAMPSSLYNSLRLVDEKNNPIRNNHEDNKVGGRQTDDSEMLEQLQTIADSTEREYLDKLRLEQQIIETSRNEPNISIQVNHIEVAQEKPKSARGFFELMLFSGLAMVVGISIFSTGITTEPALATIADLEPLMPGPIIGVVPSQDHAFDPVARRRRLIILRWTLILQGILIFSGVCVGIYWFFLKC